MVTVPGEDCYAMLFSHIDKNYNKDFPCGIGIILSEREYDPNNWVTP